MSCPAPKSKSQRAKRPAQRASAESRLPDSFTFHFRRQRGKAGGWFVNGRSVAASGVDVEAAFRDALAGLSASRKRGAR